MPMSGIVILVEISSLIYVMCLDISTILQKKTELESVHFLGSHSVSARSKYAENCIHCLILSA